MQDTASDRATELTGLRRYTWWMVPGTTAFFLVFFGAGWVMDESVPVWLRAVRVAALAAATWASVVLLNRRMALRPRPPLDRSTMWWLVTANAGSAVIGVVSLALRDYGIWAVVPATTVAITATFLRPRPRLVLLAAAAVVAPLPGWIISVGSGDDGVVHAALMPLGLLLFIAVMVLGPLWAWDIARRLNETQQLAAELAVKNERLRFAADLHDIQGHHLQVIALKSELAARLAEADADRAAAEMKEVQRLAVDALEDTRAVVRGYRRTALDDEFANATKVLAAADIDAEMHLEPAAAAGIDRLPPTARHLLGLVMREATTNVLRHSRAAHAEVDYRIEDGAARLRIANDGAGEADGDGSGTGLRALAERLAAAGGELTWEHEGGRFAVTASLPLGRTPGNTADDAMEAR
ncbi:sensor histidine kinase [Glycomyces tenuis]|uniref:sensor histidine kinase n=1 Tax=Glycomyces tenuis TaxID=58116 RepID=UPI00040D4943|nr:histidine kinase [Glycomyces tenuis]